MNIEELRDYCLSLPGAEEKMPFEGFFHNHESLLTFQIGGHIFCMADINSKPMECTIKLSSTEEIETLKEKYKAVGKPYNFSPTHWVSLTADKDIPDSEIYSLVKQSYDIISKPS